MKKKTMILALGLLFACGGAPVESGTEEDRTSHGKLSPEVPLDEPIEVDAGAQDVDDSGQTAEDASQSTAPDAAKVVDAATDTGVVDAAIVNADAGSDASSNDATAPADSGEAGGALPVDAGSDSGPDSQASQPKCSLLVLIAEDGTFLGDATSSQVGASSVCNGSSMYGSVFGVTSIFNEFGTYGSSYSLQSAYNTLSQTPPAVVCVDNDSIIAFVSKNRFLAASTIIDPDYLCSVLAQNGF